MQRTILIESTLCLALVACQANVNLGKLTDTGTTESTGEPDPSATQTATDAQATDPTTGDTTVGPDTGETTSPASDTTASTSGGGETTTGGTTGTTGMTGTTDGDEAGGTSTSGTSGEDMTSDGAALDDWTRYREVVITNPMAVTHADYQVFVKLAYDSDMNADFSDIRFTDETGAVVLDHWLENSVEPVSADYWVKVPSVLAADITTIRVYYGNPAAASASDGDATFIFFDDFEAGVLDPVKWGVTGAHKLEFGALNVSSGSVYSKKAVADWPGVMVETRMQLIAEVNGDAQTGVTAGQAQAPGPGLKNISLRGNELETYDGVNGGFVKIQDVGFPPEYFFNTFAMDSKFIYGWRDRGFGPVAQKISMSWQQPFYLYLGGVAGKNQGQLPVVEYNYSQVIVRRFAIDEPDTFVGGEETL